MVEPDDTTPSTPPGWYPDPAMAGTQRYWDGGAWSDHVAPAEQPPAAAKGTHLSAWTVAGGVIIAALVVWFVYAMATANDDVDCATKNADRTMSSQPAHDCN